MNVLLPVVAKLPVFIVLPVAAINLLLTLALNRVAFPIPLIVEELISELTFKLPVIFTGALNWVGFQFCIDELKNVIVVSVDPQPNPPS